MLKDNIDTLIAEARKSKNNIRLSVLQLIKAEIQKVITAKNAPEYTESVELKILNKMNNNYTDSIQCWAVAGRYADADRETAEQLVVQEFLPPPVTEESIENFLKESKDLPTDKKGMGICIKAVKAAFPTADGALVAKKVKEFLNI